MDDLIERLRERAQFEDKRVLDEAKAMGFEPEVYTGSQTGALLRETAAALEAAREDAERYRWLRCEAARHKAGDDPGALRVSVTYNPKRSDGNGFTGTLVTPMGDDFDAAIDQARGKGGGEVEGG